MLAGQGCLQLSVQHGVQAGSARACLPIQYVSTRATMRFRRPRALYTSALVTSPEVPGSQARLAAGWSRAPGPPGWSASWRRPTAGAWRCPRRPWNFWVGNPVANAWAHVRGHEWLLYDHIRLPSFHFLVTMDDDGGAADGPPAALPAYKIVAVGSGYDFPRPNTVTVIYDSRTRAWRCGAKYFVPPGCWYSLPSDKAAASRDGPPRPTAAAATSCTSCATTWRRTGSTPRVEVHGRHPPRRAHQAGVAGLRVRGGRGGGGVSHCRRVGVVVPRGAGTMVFHQLQRRRGRGGHAQQGGSPTGVGVRGDGAAGCPAAGGLGFFHGSGSGSGSSASPNSSWWWRRRRPGRRHACSGGAWSAGGWRAVRGDAERLFVEAGYRTSVAMFDGAAPVLREQTSANLEQTVKIQGAVASPLLSMPVYSIHQPALSLS